MTLLDPATLAPLLGATAPAAALPTGTGVAFDSQRVREGDVFFALQGARRHGIEFADEALGRGAAYLVSDRPHPRGLRVEDAGAALLELGRQARARLQCAVIGVTGSAGKTTTKAMLAATLGARATPGNFNTPYALARTLVDAALAEAAAPDAAAQPPLVLELGIDHVGEMAELTALTRPDHALVTTIGASHLAGLGDVAGVAREKGALLAAASGVKLVSASAAEHLTPELLEGVTVVGAHVALLGDHGSRLEAFGRVIELPWAGRPAAENALLALTMAVRLGVPLDTAVERLLTADLEGGRLQRRSLGQLTLIDDSYNSNPASLKAALEVLFASPAPRVAFLGDMRELGGREAEEHRAMGAATVGLDLVVGVGPASALMKERNPDARWAHDALAAAAFLEEVPPSATVLVKGSRGVQMERLVERIVERFGDAERLQP